MVTIRKGELDPPTCDTGLEHAVRHFDGLHRAVTGGEGLPILLDRQQPVANDASMRGIVAGETVELGFIGGIDAAGPVLPGLSTG